MVLGGENLHFSTLLLCFSLASSSQNFVSSSPSFPSLPPPPQFAGV